MSRVDVEPRPGVDLCECGHELCEHTHYRAGTDCAHCGCREFRRLWPLARWRRAVIGLELLVRGRS